jgi:16S rRNA (uracil1498-N3)-methyltransferase
MHRFFVSPEVLAADRVELHGDLSHRLRHVLRLRAGDTIVLLDGSGREYDVVLEDVDGATVRARVVGRRDGPPEPEVRLVLYQSLIKGDRFHWVLEKGTELGVSGFVPLVCRRNVMRPRLDRTGRRERWQRIVTEAAEQCGRSILPQLSPVTELDEALDSASGLRLLPWEEERALGLRTVLRQARLPDGQALAEGEAAGPPTVSVFVGPEGGFTRQEVERARASVVEVVSLGRRILRSETAGIAAAAAILYELGELGT